jgi:hypothetical protein
MKQVIQCCSGPQKGPVVVNKKIHIHALNRRRSPSTVYVTSCKSLCLSQHVLCKHILFKSDRTDKNMHHMTMMEKSRIVNEARCLLLAESTIQIIKDQKGCECNQKMTIGVLCSKWNSVCFVLLANTCLVVAAVHQY